MSTQLKGTIVGILVANVPALLLEQRRFVDDVDLNRIAPGKRDGNRSELYIYRLIDRIVRHFDYLIDLHTASFGRINSYYIRADMDDPVSARMALLQNPDIILHNPPRDRSLRGNADDRDIKSITVELKDPHVFQYDVIEDSLIGIRNVLYDLKMMQGRLRYPEEFTMLCRNSYWIYTDEGGILRVLPQLGQQIQKGDKIAEVRTIFGKVVKTYEAPENGIVIGKSVNPINQSGSRIIHLGVDFEKIPSRIDPQDLDIQQI
jgi:predicted deacylase